MLRKIRLTFAMICFALITLLFLDFTGTLHGWFGWLAKIQFLPAVLALNVGVILFLVILTLVCGRIYCSVICPLGVFYNPQIQISAESETKRSIFREKDKTKRSKKESAQHSKSRNKSFVMTSVSAL